MESGGGFKAGRGHPVDSGPFGEGLPKKYAFKRVGRMR